MNIRCVKWVLVLLFLVGLASPTPLRGQGTSDDGIVFLHMVLKDGKVSLVGSEVRPGKLKGRPEANDARSVTVDLLSAKGALLWSGSIPDPTLHRYEYEDPARPGILVPVFVTQEAAEFSVRIPYFAEMDRVEFSRPASANGAEVRRSLGVVYPMVAGGIR